MLLVYNDIKLAILLVYKLVMLLVCNDFNLARARRMILACCNIIKLMILLMDIMALSCCHPCIKFIRTKLMIFTWVLKNSNDDKAPLPILYDSNDYCNYGLHTSSFDDDVVRSEDGVFKNIQVGAIHQVYQPLIESMQLAVNSRSCDIAVMIHGYDNDNFLLLLVVHPFWLQHCFDLNFWLGICYDFSLVPSYPSFICLLGN